MEHTATPWYVEWFEDYSEIHIQSASVNEDNHVLSIHYGHSGNCPAHRDSGQTLQSCDPSICEGLRNAMSNAKQIEAKCNIKYCWNNVVVYPSGNEGTFCPPCIEELQKQSRQMTNLLNNAVTLRS